MISRTKLPPPTHLPPAPASTAENIKKFCTLNQASFVSNVSIVSNVSLASLAWPFFFACSVDFPLISATRQSLTFQRGQRGEGERLRGEREGEAGSALTDVKHTGEPLAGAQGVCSGGWVFLYTSQLLRPWPPTHANTHIPPTHRGGAIVVPMSKSLIFRISAFFTLPPLSRFHFCFVSVTFSSPLCLSLALSLSAF